MLIILLFYPICSPIQNSILLLPQIKSQALLFMQFNNIIENDFKN